MFSGGTSTTDGIQFNTAVTEGTVDIVSAEAILTAGGVGFTNFSAGDITASDQDVEATNNGLEAGNYTIDQISGVDIDETTFALRDENGEIVARTDEASGPKFYEVDQFGSAQTDGEVLVDFSGQVLTDTDLQPFTPLSL